MIYKDRIRGDSMLTESELSWIRDVLGDEPFGEISESYFYRKDLEIERTQNKGRVRES